MRKFSESRLFLGIVLVLLLIVILFAAERGALQGAYDAPVAGRIIEGYFACPTC